MSRKNRSPEEKARRAKIRDLLQMANIDSMDDIQNLFKETLPNLWRTVWKLNWMRILAYIRLDFTQNLGETPVCLSRLRCRLMSVP